MFGWRIRGHWAASGESGDATFVAITRTREPEEIHSLALRELVKRAVQQVSSPRQVTAEVTEDPEELETIALSEAFNVAA